MKSFERQSDKQTQTQLEHFSPETVFTPEGFRKDTEVVIDRERGEIAKVGAPDDVRDWLAAEEKKGRGSTDSVVGGAVMPGMTDAHEHPLFYSTLGVLEPVFLFGKGEAEVVAALKDAAKKKDPKEPLVALGLNTALVTDFNRTKLEEAVGGDRTAVVFDASFHGAFVTRPMGAAVEKVLERQPDASGEIDARTGKATEDYSLATLEVSEAGLTVEQIVEATEKRLDKYIGQGITSVHDLVPGTMKEFEAGLILRQRWAKRGTEFPITRFHLRPNQLKDLNVRLKDLEQSRLLNEAEIPGLIALKLFADGSFGSYTAKMSEPFERGKGSGIWFHSLPQLNEEMKLARERGLKEVSMHAIGDAGVKRAIETAREWLYGEGKTDGRKFRIEHFELPLPLHETLAEAHGVGLWVTPQPNFLLDYVYRDRLGERVRWICPHKEILNHSIPMMIGTDGMPDSMLLAMYLATHAREEHQRLSLHEALMAASLAAGEFEGVKRGAIKEGSRADIIVADKALVDRLSAGAPDVNQDTAGKTAEELEALIRRVYKSGRIAYELKK